MRAESVQFAGRMRFSESTKTAYYTQFAGKITERNLINLIQSMRAPVLMPAPHGTMDLFTFTHLTTS